MSSTCQTKKEIGKKACTAKLLELYVLERVLSSHAAARRDTTRSERSDLALNDERKRMICMTLLIHFNRKFTDFCIIHKALPNFICLLTEI